MRRSQYILFFYLLLSCRSESCYVPAGVSSLPMPLRVTRLEEVLFEAKSSEEVGAFLADEPVLRDGFFEAAQYPSLSQLATGLFKTFQSPHMAALRQEVVERYGDFSTIQSDFKRAFQHIAHYYPTFQAPHIKTIISGLYKDVYFSDDVFVISLDYFIGSEATYPPRGLPAYILARYTPEYVVPTALLYLSNRYNQTDPTDTSLLAAMVASGKTLYFLASVLPCHSEEQIIGYTREEWQEVLGQEQTIWQRFVRNRWFYTQSERWKQKLIGERPSVPEISEKCPGRIGRWLGWRIVQSYMRHNPQQDLAALMGTADARKIFALSHYKP